MKSKLDLRLLAIFKKMFQYSLGVMIITILATPVCFGIIIDTFDEYSQTVVFSGSDNSAGNISTLGALRQIVTVSGTTSVDAGLGEWSVVGLPDTIGLNRGDFRYGNFGAGLPELNFDLTGFDQFEIDISNATTDWHGDIYVKTDDGSVYTTENNILTGGAETLIIPFASIAKFSGTGAAFFSGQVIDGLEFLFDHHDLAAGSLTVTEARATNAAAAVPEPSTYALLLTGLIFLGVVGWKRRISKQLPVISK